MVPTSERDWEFDRFNDGSKDLVTNAQYRRYNRFLTQHKQSLKRIEESLGSNITDAWDFDLNPVELTVIILYSLIN
ncbi:unnamed protein product [Didymodactylos carnosus]|uniref:Uncharacterized protein n=1 Tax=Didymodactylos carnosus TaxID=1234261 RepID=A0A8S2G8K6_9BILA|nr:unnamed protein product [Didymodactylos carnosus]CAF4508313.1 unnamed protein product [Didymodactylos carnosus]